MKYTMLCLLLLVLSASAQVPTIPDVPRSLSSRAALRLPASEFPPAPFEFRGIRIGDPIGASERMFLAWKLPSLFSKPGLCGSDGIRRIETCTDVLDTGEYVNMTLLDKKVAQIYVSTDGRARGNTYKGYVLALRNKYGSPDSPATRRTSNDVANEILEEKLRWSKDGQYIEASPMERSITIGSELLDTEMDALENSQ